MAEVAVVASAGSLRADEPAGWTVPHDWTSDTESWVCTGVGYAVDVAKILPGVDAVAEIPRVARAMMSVERARE